MLTVQEATDRLKKFISHLESEHARAPRLFTVALSNEFLEWIKLLVEMLERETLSRDDLYVIFMALQHDGNPAALELASRVENMARTRLTDGVAV